LKFKETGKAEDKPRCGRLRTIRTETTIQRVAASVADQVDRYLTNNGGHLTDILFQP